MTHRGEPVDRAELAEIVKSLKQRVRRRRISEYQFITRMAALGFNATDIDQELRDAKELG